MKEISKQQVKQSKLTMCPPELVTMAGLFFVFRVPGFVFLILSARFFCFFSFLFLLAQLFLIFYTSTNRSQTTKAGKAL